MPHRILAELRSGLQRNGVPTDDDAPCVGAKADASITSDAAGDVGVTQPTGDATDPPLYDGLNAVGYIRVSTDKQADEGLSLDAQTDRIRGMAMAKGVSLADVIIDAGASAKSLDRPGMARLLALIDARAVGTVIVAKLDRLTRSVGDLVALLDRFTRRDVALVSVAESLDTRSSAGRLVLHIMASVSQWEREAISERTREALRFKRSKGERTGTLPFGFQLVANSKHKLEPAPVEQRIVARIRELAAEGRATRQIADALNADGWKTRRGHPWRFQYVARTLKKAVS